MKRSFMVRSVVAAALVGAIMPSVAHADDPFRKLGKDIKKDAGRVAHDVEHPKDAEKDAKKAGSELEKTGKQVEHTTEKDLSSREARHLFSDDEARDLAASAHRTYEKTLHDGEADYRKTVDWAKKELASAEEAALRALGASYLDRYGAFLGKLRQRIEGLAHDPEAQAILKRLVRAAAEKRVDEQTSADFQALGDRLGLVEGSPNSIVPGEAGGAFRSSWGLTWRMSAGSTSVGGGAELAVGLLGNCYKEAGKKYGVNSFVALGGLVGFVSGVDTDLAFFWKPGDASEFGPGLVGFSLLSANKLVGGTVGIQWRVFKGMNGANAGIPGFYMGYAIGVEQRAALEASWIM